MKTLKKCAALLTVAVMLFCLSANALAADSIGASVYANERGDTNTVSIVPGQEFTIYFGTDAVELGGNKINTFQFTLLYDSAYVEPVENAGQCLTENSGYLLYNRADGTRTVTDPDTQEAKEYDAYVFSFTSYDKGVRGTDAVFQPLASVKFRTKRAGTSKVFLTTEGSDNLRFLPVYSETAPQTLAASIVNAKVDVSAVSNSNNNNNNNNGGSKPSGTIFSPTTYIVSFHADGNITNQTVNSGEKVTKIADPVKAGYTFKGWYTDAQYTAEFNFNTPIRANTVLYAKFEAQGLPFTDVSANDWFYEGVSFAWENSLVSGTSATEFSPNLALTRGTLVTLLYRMENQPQAPANIFSDVASGSWYESAIAWAADKKIVSGMGDGTFAPDAEITREQIAVILYNYTSYKQGDTAVSGSADAFADGNTVSDWAANAVNWALGKGLIKGVGDNMLAPQNSATRAEIVTILMRYMGGAK